MEGTRKEWVGEDPSRGQRVLHLKASSRHSTTLPARIMMIHAFAVTALFYRQQYIVLCSPSLVATHAATQPTPHAVPPQTGTEAGPIGVGPNGMHSHPQGYHTGAPTVDPRNEAA